MKIPIGQATSQLGGDGDGKITPYNNSRALTPNNNLPMFNNQSPNQGIGFL